MAYLGNLGSLVELKCAASLSKQAVRPARARMTLGGVNTIQVGARTNRTWDVSLSDASTPAQHAAVQAFVEGEHGLGPWCFVSDWAAVTNVISPRGSVLETDVPQVGTSINGGPLSLPDGTTAGRSWLVTGTELYLPWVDGLEYLPIIPGRRVTASVFAQGQGARLRLAFYTASGSFSRYVTQSRVIGTGVERLTLSATPNEDEARMLMVLDQGVTRVARPAVSWTEDVRPWSVGEGAPMVHVSGVSSNVVLATRTQQYASASFQVVEVG